jgi:hypothetical protein
LLNVQTIHRYLLSQGSKSGNRRLRARAFHPLLRKTGAFKLVFCNIQFADRKRLYLSQQRLLPLTFNRQVGHAIRTRT